MDSDFELSFTEAEWRIYSSVNEAIIGSDNGLFVIKPLSEPVLIRY